MSESRVSVSFRSFVFQNLRDSFKLYFEPLHAVAAMHILHDAAHDAFHLFFAPLRDWTGKVILSISLFFFAILSMTVVMVLTAPIAVPFLVNKSDPMTHKDIGGAVSFFLGSTLVLGTALAAGIRIKRRVPIQSVMPYLACLSSGFALIAITLIISDHPTRASAWGLIGGFFILGGAAGAGGGGESRNV